MPGGSEYDSLASRSSDKPDPPHRAMVQWYRPGLWLSTGVQVLISTILGQRFDYRLMERAAGVRVPGAARRPADRGGDQIVDVAAFDYTGHAGKGPFYFDYLADTGDGWNPTYAIASLVSQDEIQIGDQRLPRGAFLLMGGDEVYPDGSKTNYRERLVAPFSEAWGTQPVPPGLSLFAIPGNHDWYDGLISFSRQFRPGRHVGGWTTAQTRSYFAIRLPYQWWLWAVDIQLEADIDIGQRDYFEKIAADLKRGDRVIMASAEPDWLYRDIKDPAVESNLGYLESQIVRPRGADVYVWLAGDLHHYRRHARLDDSRYQRIVCGGGGAYLSPTHQSVLGPAGNVARRTVEVGSIRYEQQCAFPQASTSWRLSLLNFFFLFRNWPAGLLMGLFYASATWLHPENPINLEQFLSDPARLLWGLLVAGAATFFSYSSGRDGRSFRLIGGLAHAAAHISLALYIAHLSYHLCKGFDDKLYFLLAQVGLNYLGGAICGPILLGIYLLIAANVFGAHTDEAFSALRVQDYKAFLRLRIFADGMLEIFPIGVPRVPRDGEARGEYLLIEGPVRVRPRVAGPAA